MLNIFCKIKTLRHQYILIMENTLTEFLSGFADFFSICNKIFSLIIYKPMTERYMGSKKISKQMEQDG